MLWRSFWRSISPVLSVERARWCVACLLGCGALAGDWGEGRLIRSSITLLRPSGEYLGLLGELCVEFGWDGSFMKSSFRAFLVLRVEEAVLLVLGLALASGALVVFVGDCSGTSIL